MSFKHKVLAASYPAMKIANSVFRQRLNSVQGRLRVLVYHDIAPFEIETFAKQIHWLAKKWRFVDAQTFASMVSGNEPVYEDCLLLTFDDGFASNRVAAEKVLHDMGIRAIFFVVSDFVDISSGNDCRAFIARGIRADIAPDLMPSHWRPMNWVDLQYLISMGHTIGAHTATHARLSLLTEKVALETEIIDSANVLETRLGVKIDHFAFTFGDCSSMSCAALAVAKRRFKFIHTSLRGNNVHATANATICRDTVAPNDPLYLIGAFLEGGADFLYTRARNAVKGCL
jgi:peptidoglycan/xylan/chitin deacetylase (PgdA/CDA1 family)